MQEDTITHNFPVWRDRSNFIIAVRLTESNVPSNWKWEQIWARQVEENIFEICCIPFFAYGLSLGDWVDTHTLEGKKYVINNLLKPSSYHIFRIWLTTLVNKNSIVSYLTEFECLVEIRGENSKLISVASSIDSLNLVRDYLSECQKNELLNYEDGNPNKNGLIS